MSTVEPRTRRAPPDEAGANAAAAMTVSPLASPSSPSVRLTAFEKPTMKIAAAGT